MPIGSLVSDQPTATTPQYCTVADVARVLQIPTPSEASDEGEPTRTLWETTIKRVEDLVDQTCGQSWRIRQVLLEYGDITTWISIEGFFLFELGKKPVRTLSAASGDVLEVWIGSGWEDWLALKTEGRANDYWLEEPSGYLRIRRSSIPWSEEARIRLSYRYGESTVPPSIAEATALLAAARLATGDRIAVGGRGGTLDRLDVSGKVQDWRRDAYATLAMFQRVGKGY